MTDVNPTDPGNNSAVAAAACWATPRPLTRARKDGTLYVREPGTEKHLRDLGALSEKARRARLALSDRKADGFVGEEALVYAIRTYHRAGDDDAAWSLADLLTERVAGHVRREMDKWRLSPDEADECARDLFAALFEALFDLGPAGEFWEVRFWVCLDRRLWNLLDRRQAQADLQATPMDDDGEAGAGEMREDPLARLADSAAVSPERRALLQEALALLTENERLAVYLCRVEGWPEESDDPDRPSAARALGVTGRSVRNYLRRAETKLLAWEQSGKDV